MKKKSYTDPLTQSEISGGGSLRISVAGTEKKERGVDQSQSC